MNIRIIRNSGICLVLALFNVTTATAQIRVGPDVQVKTIEQAVELAEPGATIIVPEGRYPVHSLAIDKPLTLEGRGRVILDGEQEGHVLKIISDSVTIRDIEVHNSSFSFMEDYAGILIEGVHDVLIENVLLVDNYFGIYLAKSSGVTLRNNTIRSNAVRESTSGNGIHLWYSKEITVEGNNISAHRDGIYFEFVEDSHIRNNVSRDNLRYGLHFMYSDYCVYTENTFRNNGAGVAVMYTKHIEMTDNRFEQNWGANTYGLLLKEIGDSRITGNTFEENTVAIYAEAASRVDVNDNDFIRNGWAIRIKANSVDTRFIGNNFIENTFDVGTNSRQHYNHFEANYWSHYEGYDLDRDGVGDTPYRPVRLFSLIIEQQPASLILLRSMFISLLDTAERLMPVLTPKTLADNSPKMNRIR